MELRVVQWNLHMNSKAERTRDFIAERIGPGPTVVCLEEVRPLRYRMLVDSLKPTSSRFSLDLRKAGKNEGRGRQLGIAVLAFGLSIVSYELPERTVYPERTLSALLDGDFGPVRVVAFHSLAGVNFGQMKASNFAAIADYLQLHRSELDFLCFDGNEPNHDSMDVDKIVFGHSDKGLVKRMALIMGKEKVHNLTDSYTDYLQSTGREVSGQPLAVSYDTGKGVEGEKQGERRYDYVMHSPRWRVMNCEYPYGESIKATSDHSAVIVDFELRQGPV